MTKTIFFVLLLLSLPLFSADARIVKISVFASGKILVNGNKADMNQVKAALAKAKSVNGGVYYYREAAKSEPAPEAMQVIKLVFEFKLPVRMSTKPDFSNYLGSDGKMHPVK